MEETRHLFLIYSHRNVCLSLILSLYVCEHLNKNKVIWCHFQLFSRHSSTYRLHCHPRANPNGSVYIRRAVQITRFTSILKTAPGRAQIPDTPTSSRVNCCYLITRKTRATREPLLTRSFSYECFQHSPAAIHIYAFVLRYQQQ